MKPQRIRSGKAEPFFRRYPCLRGQVQPESGRISLPVSPVSNLQCHFGPQGLKRRRQLNQLLLEPVQAAAVLGEAFSLWPAVKTVDIAGPGESLASRHALETFGFIRERHPDLETWLTTNGLLLRDQAAALAAAGIKRIAIELHAVTVGIAVQLYSYVLYRNRYLTGPAAASWLLLAQSAGIGAAAALGATLKVKTVLVPGINDSQIAAIAETAAKAGASLIELEAARQAASRFLPVWPPLPAQNLALTDQYKTEGKN